MSKLTRLRVLFHELPNSINAVNVASFTIASYLEQLDDNNINKRDVRNAILTKLANIEKSHKKVINIFNSICAIVKRFGLPKDCSILINELHMKNNDIRRLITNVKKKGEKVFDKDFNENVSHMAQEFHKIETECHSAGDQVKKFKDRLVSLNKYYTVT